MPIHCPQINLSWPVTPTTSTTFSPSPSNKSHNSASQLTQQSPNHLHALQNRLNQVNSTFKIDTNKQKDKEDVSKELTKDPKMSNDIRQKNEKLAYQPNVNFNHQEDKIQKLQKRELNNVNITRRSEMQTHKETEDTNNNSNELKKAENERKKVKHFEKIRVNQDQVREYPLNVDLNQNQVVYNVTLPFTQFSGMNTEEQMALLNQQMRFLNEYRQMLTIQQQLQQQQGQNEGTESSSELEGRSLMSQRPMPLTALFPQLNLNLHQMQIMQQQQNQFQQGDQAETNKSLLSWSSLEEKFLLVSVCVYFFEHGQFDVDAVSVEEKEFDGVRRTFEELRNRQQMSQQKLIQRNHHQQHHQQEQRQVGPRSSHCLLQKLHAMQQGDSKLNSGALDDLFRLVFAHKWGADLLDVRMREKRNVFVDSLTSPEESEGQHWILMEDVVLQGTVCEAFIDGLVMRSWEQIKEMYCTNWKVITTALKFNAVSRCNRLSANDLAIRYNKLKQELSRSRQENSLYFPYTILKSTLTSIVDSAKSSRTTSAAASAATSSRSNQMTNMQLTEENDRALVDALSFLKHSQDGNGHVNRFTLPAISRPGATKRRRDSEGTGSDRSNLSETSDSDPSFDTKLNKKSRFDAHGSDGDHKQRRTKWQQKDLRILWESIAEFGNEWLNVQRRLIDRTYHQVKDKGKRLLHEHGWATGRTKPDNNIACENAKRIAQQVLAKAQIPLSLMKQEAEA